MFSGRGSAVSQSWAGDFAPILPAVPVLGDGYHPLQPQLLTLKEGYEHQPPGLPGDIKYHTEDRALSPGLCVQSRIFPSCSVAETQPSSCKNAGEWFKGTGRTLAGEILVFLYGWVYFQGLVGGAEDYRGKRSGFAPAFRELCGPGLLGVTDKTADVESGTWACSQLSPAPLSPSTRRQDGPHKTRDLKGPFWSKNEFSRAVQELHNFSQCHKRTYRLREREKATQPSLWTLVNKCTYGGPSVRFSFFLSFHSSLISSTATHVTTGLCPSLQAFE